MLFRKFFNILLLLLFIFEIVSASSQRCEKLRYVVNSDSLRLLSEQYVDLRGKPGTIILSNQSADTLRLRGEFHYHTPNYSEHIISRIPPGQRDTVHIRYAYPDFFSLSSSAVSRKLRLYNGPGRKLLCHIQYFQEDSVNVKFEGEFAPQNDYYLEYQKFFGTYNREFGPDNAVVQAIRDFNQYAPITDSVLRANLQFIESYEGYLPAWFITHEKLRLRYGSGSNRITSLSYRRFATGEDVSVSPSYFDFIQELPLIPEGMILNTAYLRYLDSYCLWKLQTDFEIDTPRSIDQYLVIDKELKDFEIGDLLKIRNMGHLFKRSEIVYDSLLRYTRYVNPDNKKILDSIVSARYRLPLVGRRAPDISLIDLQGDSVSLADFSGKLIMLNFWASWCIPCIKQFPYENAISQKFDDHGLAVINICIETPLDHWKALSIKSGLQMTNLYAGPSENIRSLKSRYNIESLPRSILLSPTLTVIDNYFLKASQLTEPYLKELIQKYQKAMR